MMAAGARRDPAGGAPALLGSTLLDGKRRDCGIPARLPNAHGSAPP